MNESQTLELNFLDAGGAKTKINIRKPRPNLTKAEIEPAMNAIIGANIFQEFLVDQYANVDGARYVRRTVEDIF